MSEYELFNVDYIELAELIDKAKVALRYKNKEYKKLLDEVIELKENNPNLQLIFEDDKYISLTKNDCKMLQKLVSLELEIRNFEEQEIFFLGGKEAYFYFKNIGILKEWFVNSAEKIDKILNENLRDFWEKSLKIGNKIQVDFW